MTRITLATILLLASVCPGAAEAVVQSGGVTGTVTVEHTGEPVSGADVTVAGRSATSDATGAFEIRDLPPGTHVLEIRHAVAELMVERRVQVDAGRVATVEVTLRAPAVQEEVHVSDPLHVLGVVPGRAVISARAAAPIAGTPLVLWTHVRNLADRLYISDVQDGLRPGPGRTVSAGVRVAF